MGGSIMKRQGSLSTFVLCLLVACTAGAGAEAATGPARLLKDINETRSYEMNSFPGDFHLFKDFTLFRASTWEAGTEVWRTDGTESGTWLVKDIWPGTSSGALDSSNFQRSPFDPADLAGQALFMANDGVHGWELWKSDGTEAGTAMVKELRPGANGPFDSAGSSISPPLTWTHVEAGGLVYFAADDGVHGFELWRTDGTEAGTFLLMDILPGSQSALVGSSGVAGLVALVGLEVGSNLFFTANDGAHGRELWKTDGTPAGTNLVMDIAPGVTGSLPSAMFDVNGLLLFWAASTPGNYEPWRSDGTDLGTYLVEEIWSGPSGIGPEQMVDLDGIAIFTISQYLFASDGTPNTTGIVRAFSGSFTRLFGALDHRVLMAAEDTQHGLELWATNGSGPGTVLVKDIRPGPDGSSPSQMIAVGGKRFFFADDGVHGRELWVTDGTEAGTQFVFDITPGPDGTFTGLFAADDRCYLFNYQDARLRLWSSDGTQAGTHRVENHEIGDFIAGVAPDGTFLFVGSDDAHGKELWRSDGTESGTALVKDVNPIVRSEPSSPTYLGAVSVPGAGDRMLFKAYDPAHGVELWASDGSPRGTRLLKDIQPGPGSSLPFSAVALGGALYFIANDGAHGDELWRSDGTEAGTTMVADIFPGPLGSVNAGSSVPLGPVALRGTIYLIAEDELHGRELWRSDGTASGTYLVAETAPGRDSLFLGDLVATDSLLFFKALSPSFLVALWKSDGTQDGTAMLKDPAIDGPSSSRFFVAIGGNLFFDARDKDHGFEPWMSDGTEAGTRMLRDIRPGAQSSRRSLYRPKRMGGAIYFAASDGVHGEDLWKTDGTEAGTISAIDLGPGLPSSLIFDMAVSDERLYVSTRTSSSTTYELLKTDGTEAGTVTLKSDFEWPPVELAAVYGGAVFTVEDAPHGNEMWITDGTAQGTRLAQDIVPGPISSRPYDLVKMGSRVFFVADETATGREPWAARTAILLGNPDQAVRDMRGDVVALGLSSGLETSLLAKLDSVARALDRGHSRQALHGMEVFARHVEVLSPKWIPEAAAADLLDFAAETAALIGDAP